MHRRDIDLSPVGSIEDLAEEMVGDIHDRYALSEATDKGVKSTIYHKSPDGSIGKIEGFVTEVTRSGVTFIPARGRRERTIMSYYTPFWMVVAGWGHPTPDRGEKVVSSDSGVTVTQGMYRSQDPRWVEDFLASTGKGLKALAIYRSPKFENPGKLPGHGGDSDPE